MPIQGRLPLSSFGCNGIVFVGLLACCTFISATLYPVKQWKSLDLLEGITFSALFIGNSSHV